VGVHATLLLVCTAGCAGFFSVCLHSQDPDVSIRKRALVLVNDLVNEENARYLTGELLNYLVGAAQGDVTPLHGAIAAAPRESVRVQFRWFPTNTHGLRCVRFFFLAGRR
jgi:hypothetical protein